MSTNINISVGDNKLLAQASLQQNASRQAQLEKEGNKRLGAQATDARTKELAAKGLDAQGNPLIGTPFQVPQLERRPAANRVGLPGVLLIPSSGYESYGGTLSGIRGNSQGSRPVFSRLSLSTWIRPNVDNGVPPVFSWGRNFPEFNYLPNGGPASTGALELNPNNTNTGVVQYNPFEYSGDTPIPGEQFYYWRTFEPIPGVGYFDEYTPNPFGLTTRVHSMQSLAYALTSNEYDAIPDWQGSNNVTDPVMPSVPLPPYQLLTLNNTLATAVPKVKWNDVPNFTQEFFVRCGNGNLEPGKIYRTVVNVIPERRGEIFLSFAGVTVRFRYYEDMPATNPEIAAWTVYDLVRNTFVSIRDYTVSPKLTSDISIYGNSSLAPNFFTSSTAGGGPSSSHYLIDDEEWVHIAIVKKQVNGESRWSVYYKGKNINPALSVTESAEWSETYGQQPVSARISAFCSNGAFSPPAPFLPAIHGYRFTPRARYLADFTPPSSITSLA